MVTPTRSLLAVGSLLAAALAVVACSSAPATGSTTGSSTKGANDDDESSSSSSSSSGGATSSSSSSSSSSSGSTSSSSGGPDATKCAAEKDMFACFDCCAPDKTAMKAGEDAYQACLCGASGVCKTECAQDVCAGADTEPSQACMTCMDSKGASCEQAADTACQANAACKAASAATEACAKTANCESKPEQ